MKKDYIGFGYNPAESDNHFYVVIDADPKMKICIYERFGWDEEGEQIIRKAEPDSFSRIRSVSVKRFSLLCLQSLWRSTAISRF